MDKIEYEVPLGRHYGDDTETRCEPVDDWARWLLMDVRSIDTRIEVTMTLCLMLIPVLLKHRPELVGEVASLIGCPGRNHRMINNQDVADAVSEGSQKDDVSAFTEHSLVRVARDVQADGYHVKADSIGTIVNVYNDGKSFAVEFPDIGPGPVVVTLVADDLLPSKG